MKFTSLQALDNMRHLLANLHIIDEMFPNCTHYIQLTPHTVIKMRGNERKDQHALCSDEMT